MFQAKTVHVFRIFNRLRTRGRKLTSVRDDVNWIWKVVSLMCNRRTKMIAMRTQVDWMMQFSRLVRKSLKYSLGTKVMPIRSQVD